MTPHEVLIAARARIADPAKWGQGVSRHDTHTECASDAIANACRAMPVGDPYFKATAAAYEAFKRVIGHWSIAVWNDQVERVHADVTAAFDRAIAVEGAT